MPCPIRRTYLRATTTLLLLVFSAFGRPGAAQELSPDEARIAAYIEQHAEEAVDLLARITDINSGTLNSEGIRAVGDVLRPHFDALGFDTRWIDLPDSLQRAGHLFAERTGNRGRRLLLIGHLDTVFEPDHPFQRFVRDGDTARGPGVADMKGGDIVMLFALKALAHVGALDGTTITVALIGDEERPGRPLAVTRAPLIEAAKRSDVALGFETGARDGTQEYVTLARRSASSWTLRVEGRQGHSSGVFSEAAGSGAIYEAARILSTFHDSLRGEPYLTFNPGLILGGTNVAFDAEQGRGTASGKTNVIAQEAVVTGDIRTLTDEQLERTRDRMRAIVARHLPHTRAEISFTEGYPAMPPTEGNRALMDLFNEINRDLGLAPLEALDPGRRGAADISFAAPYVDALAALGAYGWGTHSAEEAIDLATLPLVTTRAALLLYRLTR